MNLTPFIVSWAVLAAVVMALAIYRKAVANKEDDFVHVSSGDAKVLENQLNVAKKLSSIDMWGKILTVVAGLYGLGIAAAYLYQGWVESSQIHIR